MSDQMPPFDPSKVDPHDPFADLPKDGGAPAAPAAPPADPAAAAPPPAAAPQAPPAPDAPPAPATPRTWKIPLVVGGETREYEVSEEAFTNPESDAAKRLRASLQRDADYDRPGGAMDQQARRLAAEMAQEITRGNLAQMERDGIVERSPQDGKYYYTEQYKAFVAKRNAPPEPAAPAAPPAEDPRVAQLADLDKQIESAEAAAESDDPDVDSKKAYVALTRLNRQRAELAADIRADKYARTEAQRIREEQSSREAKTQEQRNIEQATRTLETTVNASLERHASALVDPITGKPLPKEVVEDLRATAYDKAVIAAQRAGNPEAGFAAAKSWLDGQLTRRATEIEQYRKAIPKIAPAAPAAAPTFGGGAPPPATRPVTFNKNDPFDDKSLAEHFAANGRA